MKQLLVFVALLLLVLPAASALTLNVLTTNPAPLQAGTFADVTLELESATGETTHTNLDVNVIESEVIKVVSANQGEFDIFRPGRVATYTVRIFVAENTPEGYVDLEFVATSDQLTKQEFSERVFVQEAESKPELYIGSVTSIPQELLPDTDDNEIEVTIQNLGDTDAELLRATLQVPEGITAAYSYSLEDSISSVSSGGEGTFTFTFDIDETVQESVAANLQLRYRYEEPGRSSYETQTTVIPLNIEIVEAPLLVIDSVEQLSSFAGGSTENKVKVGITNKGLVAAEEVRVRVVPDISYPFIFETTTQYVSSNIAPGKTAYVMFTTEVTSEAQDQEYTLTTKLDSLVGEARYTREDTLALTTTSKQSVPKSVIAFAVIGVVILFAVIIGIRARRRK